jgi:hypothetical protein
MAYVIIIQLIIHCLSVTHLSLHGYNVIFYKYSPIKFKIPDSFFQH